MSGYDISVADKNFFSPLVLDLRARWQKFIFLKAWVPPSLPLF